MSRVAKRKVILPAGVSYFYDESKKSYVFKGPAGESELKNMNGIVLSEKEGEITFSSLKLPLSHVGTFNVLFRNAAEGVFKLYEKKLQMYGVGYKAALSGDSLELFVGKSHTEVLNIPNYIVCELSANKTEITIKCVSKDRLGDFVANIKGVRKMNPYKTKGILESGVVPRKKEGKKK